MRSVKFYLIEGIKFVKEARDKVTEKIKIIANCNSKLKQN